VAERRPRSGASQAPLAALSILRSGGVAGLMRRRTIDVASLTKAQRQALEALAASPAAGPSPGADRFTFTLTLAYADGTTREITVPEERVPDALADLLR
jgi:hypothetical protein